MAVACRGRGCGKVVATGIVVARTRIFSTTNRVLRGEESGPPERAWRTFRRMLDEGKVVVAILVDCRREKTTARAVE